MCPGRPPQPIPSTAYGVSERALPCRPTTYDPRRRKGTKIYPNSIFSGRYRADVTWGTRESSRERSPFRIIGDRGRTVIRTQGRLITRFIPAIGAKVRFSHLDRILLETVSTAWLFLAIYLSLFFLFTDTSEIVDSWPWYLCGGLRMKLEIYIIIFRCESETRFYLESIWEISSFAKGERSWGDRFCIG